MRIAFKFHYIHENGLFTRLLNHIQERTTTLLFLYQEGQHYRIEAEGDQATLESLAEQIAALVPQSIFLREYKIEAVEQEEDSAEGTQSLPQKDLSFKVPYCPECQVSVIRTFDPFIPCTVCGFSEIALNMDALTAYTGIKAEKQEVFFKQLATSLLQKGELILPTFNGIRRFSLLNAEHKSEGLLVCDPSDLSDKFLITQGELDALMMVEKPSVRLKPKLKFRALNGLDKPFYPVFFPDDKITLALTTALKDQGINTVFCDHSTKLRVASALQQHIIIAQGRDMLPYSVDLTLSHPSFCEYGGFQAYGDTKGLVVADRLNLNGRPFIRYLPKGINEQVDNAIRFEPAHAAMRSIVIEHALEEKSLCGIYLSKVHPSHIFSYSAKIGYTPMVLLNDQTLSQPVEMLEGIKSMNESGMKLVENFKDKFPELYDKIVQTKFNTTDGISDITKIWSIAAVFLGLYEGNDALESCEVLESTAIEFNGKSGPRIDYKVISNEEGYQLDLRLAIRSAMSFKLAGLDDYLLSFGFIDSLADFIAQQAEDSDANIGIQGVTLSGSLFENRQLLMRTYNGLDVNYPIYRNERLSMDNANIALGAITLGSE